ncbi:hypothetical protein OJF2_79260 (plasmid) [Aquisphaera giovannonii]|uniref:Uncharacterized protein n=1 Tax=Aquisphaera giovannonii TaxID=406548 RepID=A0A5B9WHE9_9BACT|nr:hypothetical protein [Aquisphaera giovannonii]QEH39311.1 hypothetical protein OJF2_79260 [Aquisphaera giovannonii]
MRLAERLAMTSDLDSKITALIVEALKAGVNPEEVRDALARIAGLVEAGCE